MEESSVRKPRTWAHILRADAGTTPRRRIQIINRNEFHLPDGERVRVLTYRSWHPLRSPEDEYHWVVTMVVNRKGANISSAIIESGFWEKKDIPKGRR